MRKCFTRKGFVRKCFIRICFIRICFIRICFTRKCFIRICFIRICFTRHPFIQSDPTVVPSLMNLLTKKAIPFCIFIHCPKSNIVKRNVYLYSKKCLSGTEEMFLYCKSPCWERKLCFIYKKCLPHGFSVLAKKLFFAVKSTQL